MWQAMGFAGLVAGFAIAWRLKIAHYQHLEWRTRVRQVKETRAVLLRDLPWTVLAAAGVVLAVRVLF